jgi:hypothetical protein
MSDTLTVVFGGTVSGTSLPVGVTLKGGHSYRWHVIAVSSDGPSEYSSYAVFAVDNSLDGMPPKPVPTWPIHSASIFDLSPVLEWYLGGNYSSPVTYDVQLFNNSDLVTPVFALAGIQLEKAPVAVQLLTGSSYSWKVQTHAGAQVSGYSDLSQFSIDGSLVGNPKPYEAWPTGGATIFDLKPTLEWYLIGTPAGVVTYELEIKTESVPFDGLGTILTPGAAASYTVASSLASGTAYHWRARLHSSTAGASDWSDGGHFSIASMDGSVVTPLTGSPVGGVNVPSNSVCLSWFLTTSPAASQTYRLEISNSQDMSKPVVYDKLSQLNQTVNSLSNGTYYWRVVSQTVNGKSSGYSNKGVFHVGGATGVNEENIIPAKFEVFQNYPNPFNPSTTIKYGLPAAANVTIKVYDMLGQEVKTLVNEYKNAGTFNVQWNGDNKSGSKVSSGTYIFRVVSGSNIQTIKMILLK